MQDIKGYKIIRTLGAGNFGTTFEVEKEKTRYALKLIRENIMDKEAVHSRRIEREIRILKAVDNENVVKYVDDGFISDGVQKYRYIVMEYVEGETLEARIEKSLTIQEACVIAKNIFIGINAIHSNNIIHRDLKPSNIIVTNHNMDIKIIDFGISKLIDASTLTTTGQGMGTFAYMAPEQLRSAKDIDYRADYYSAAAIMYELISKERPLKMSNQLEAIHKILSETPEPLATKVPSIPIEISELVENLLKKQPFERNIPYDTIVSVLEKHKKTGIRTGPKIMTLYFNSEIEFLPMVIQNDAKAVVEYHNSHFIKGAVFNAPQLLHSDKNYLELSQHNLRLIIDPYTQTLGYSAFTTKPTYKKIPYLISALKKETPKDFFNITVLQNRVKKVIDLQEFYKASIFLAPFHFIESHKDDWLNVDYNAYKESKSYIQQAGINKPVYYGISFEVGQFEDIDYIKDLVNLVTSANPDGYYLQISGNFDSTNTNHYLAYAYLVKMLADSKREIILSRINDFSRGLIALGANTISAGLGQSDNFKKEYLEREQGGGTSRRYYVEKLMGLYNQNMLEDILSTNAGLSCVCHCDFCQGASNTNQLTEFNNVIKHHLFIKNKQMKELSSLHQAEKMESFMDSVAIAIQLIKDINKEKRIKNFGYSHLEAWRDVILEVSKSNFNNASHM
ncbi:serine/threonine-protein kinase [Gorillibacterium timonense]|uniref:serine/threonine-protein kinase n=1 Tax=Gorillibacterium timonense TaxID=1689269 RepID=UPI00071D570D|nr:serine/threonine-protein kinase [Gorillibacterium timonense]